MLDKIELGEVDADWATLRILAQALDCPLGRLIALAEEMAPGEGGEEWRGWSQLPTQNMTGDEESTEQIETRTNPACARSVHMDDEDEQTYIDAITDPLRRQILRTVVAEKREVSPARLGRRLEQDVSRVSYHVKRLETAGLLSLTRTSPVRGATEHFYTANPVVTRHPILRALFE